jgi:DNA-binding XRE family transcriptional regulator
MVVTDHARFCHAFGRILEQQRLAHRKRQQDIADVCNVSTTTIDRWEAGDGCPNVWHLFQIGRTLDLTPEFFLRTLNGWLAPDGANEHVDAVILNTPRRTTNARRFVRLHSAHQTTIEDIFELLLVLAENAKGEL